MNNLIDRAFAVIEKSKGFQETVDLRNPCILTCEDDFMEMMWMDYAGFGEKPYCMQQAFECAQENHENGYTRKEVVEVWKHVLALDVVELILFNFKLRDLLMRHKFSEQEVARRMLTHEQP